MLNGLPAGAACGAGDAAGAGAAGAFRLPFVPLPRAALFGFAGRTGEPLDLGATRQVMMADSVMMKALGIPLRLARDVSSMPWRGPLSRPDHAANLVSRHAKRAITYLSIARAADRHALQA